MFYIDTSAFLKLLLVEQHSAAMRAWWSADRDCWSSQLLVTETMRAGQRAGLTAESVDAALDHVNLVTPTAMTYRAAGLLQPDLRSLDALHLASALELVPEVEAVVAYDQRVIHGARAAGIRVVSPR